nr:unnamed protein product [Callosobruchus analis]
MGERKGTNKYYPPDYDPRAGGLNKFLGTHALRERARKIHEGIIIIRFEMPYNIWCEGCQNHIGMGVRYNAEKTKVGMYYTTPVYQFKMKCHLCDNHFVIKTDPAKANCDLKKQVENDNMLLKKSSLDIPLLPERDEDIKVASLLSMKLKPGKSISESTDEIRKRIISESSLPTCNFSRIKEEKAVKMLNSAKKGLGIIKKRQSSSASHDCITSNVDYTLEKKHDNVSKNIVDIAGVERVSGVATETTAHGGHSFKYQTADNDVAKISNAETFEQSDTLKRQISDGAHAKDSDLVKDASFKKVKHSISLVGDYGSTSESE